MEDKIQYHCVCFYTTSKHESRANVLATSAANAANWAKNYFTTIALTIQRIEIYVDRNAQPVYTINYPK